MSGFSKNSQQDRILDRATSRRENAENSRRLKISMAAEDTAFVLKVAVRNAANPVRPTTCANITGNTIVSTQYSARRL